MEDMPARIVPVNRLASFGMDEDELDPVPSSRPAPVPAPAGGALLPPRRFSQPQPPAAVVAPAIEKPSPGPSMGEEMFPAAVVGEVQKHSNVKIPPELAARVEAYCEAKDFSHAGLIIAAIEFCHDRLPMLLHPTGAPSVFPGGRKTPQRRRRGIPLTPLYYRLTDTEFEVLDKLVEQVQAGSRANLISVALDSFLTYHHS